MAEIILTVSHEPSADKAAAVSARLDEFVAALVDEDGVASVTGSITTGGPTAPAVRAITVTAPPPGDDTPEG